MTALGRLLEACERATDHLHATYSDSLAAGCDPSDIHKACPVALELDRAVEAIREEMGEGAVTLPMALVKDLCFDLAVRSDICGMKLFRALYEVKVAAVRKEMGEAAWWTCRHGALCCVEPYRIDTGGEHACLTPLFSVPPDAVPLSVHEQVLDKLREATGLPWEEACKTLHKTHVPRVEVERLARHCDHTEGCGGFTGYPRKGDGCTCGLDAALRACGMEAR